jgi:hypothetical protein
VDFDYPQKSPLEILKGSKPEEALGKAFGSISR